jgi:hypothetical protein
MVVEVHQHDGSSGGTGWIVGLLVVVVLALVVWFVVMRGGLNRRTDINVDVNVPGQTTGGGNTGNGGGGGSTTNR